MDTSLRSTQPTKSKYLEDTNLTTSAVGKVTMTIFWDCEDVRLVDFLPHGTTINGPYYALLLHQLRSSIREKYPRKLMCDVLLFRTTHLFTSLTSHRLHRTESSCIFSRSCIQRLSSVLKCEEFSLWQEL